MSKNGLMEYNQAQIKEMLIYWNNQKVYEGREMAMNEAFIEWTKLHGSQFNEIWKQDHKSN
mgnify:CR=1 FL=1